MSLEVSLTQEEKLLARLLWDALKNSLTKHDLIAAREAFAHSSLPVRSALLRAEIELSRRGNDPAAQKNPFEA